MYGSQIVKKTKDEKKAIERNLKDCAERQDGDGGSLDFEHGMTRAAMRAA